MMFTFKKSNRVFSLLILSGVLFSAASMAGDINAGKAKSALCAGCHGLNGISAAPNYPNLAGQKKNYLKMAINSYRSGTRNDPTMKAMVAGLNDADADNLAAYFSSLAR